MSEYMDKVTGAQKVYPSDADVVEVVRCKDCKYWLPHMQLGCDEDYGEYHNYCALHVPDDEWYAEEWNADDFCSMGERKK